MTAIDLAKSKCQPCDGATSALSASEVARLLKHLQGWAHEKGAIVKTYPFRNYYQTLAFVNATA